MSNDPSKNKNAVAYNIIVGYKKNCTLELALDSESMASFQKYFEANLIFFEHKKMGPVSHFIQYSPRLVRSDLFLCQENITSQQL